MPSMSYCKFENTEIDMRQCVRAMEDAANFEELEMDIYEKNAFERLYRLCDRFVKESKRLKENE